MKSTGIRFLVIAVSLITALGGFSVLALTINMEPEGLRKGQRMAYEKRMAEIRREQELAEQLDKDARPKAVPIETRFDFGTLDPHSSASHVFKVQNLGDAPLELKAGDTTCKCTVGKVGADVVPPGYSTPVTLEWNTGYQDLEYEQKALVHTNDPANPTLEFTIFGKVRTELAVTDSILQFPATDPGKLVEVETYVYSQLWDEFLIETVSCDIPGFQWSAEPVRDQELPGGDLEAKSAWKLKISALPQTYAKFAGVAKLTAISQDGSGHIEKEIQLSGSVRRPISFQDPEIHDQRGLDLGVMRTGQEYRRSLILRVRSNEDLPIEVLDVKPEILKVEIEPIKAKPGTYRLTLIVPSDVRPTQFNILGNYGYVQVGNRKVEGFKGWLPLVGAVVPPVSNK